MKLNKTIRTFANVIAFAGRSKASRNRIRRRVLQWFLDRGLIKEDAAPIIGYDFEKLSYASSILQDMNFPREVGNAERLIVMVVPEHNAMSGGIYSFFSITDHLRKMKMLHRSEVVVMTRPQEAGLTYFRNTNFTNSENIFRFSQLQRCSNLKELYLLLPEYASASFLDNLSKKEILFLLSLNKLSVNILNQNVKLMPKPEQLEKLRSLTSEVTQSVAHHSYFSQEMADAYQTPTLLLPAYTDLSAYSPIRFEDKEKMIIYSPDDAPHKQECLSLLKKKFPEYQLIEIRDITFDEFMDLATRCMFSITFGEGFDGYLAQPIYQGGIGFAVYEEQFFPSKDFLKYKNIFSSADDMLKDICDRITFLESNPEHYKDLNRKWIEEYKELYSLDEYRSKIKKLAVREFELFPTAALTGSAGV